MARTLGCPASTISRELARNTCALHGYTSARAQASSDRRRAPGRPPARLDPQGMLWRVVCSLLDWRWSPQQISCPLKRLHPVHPLTAFKKLAAFMPIHRLNS